MTTRSLINKHMEFSEASLNRTKQAKPLATADVRPFRRRRLCWSIGGLLAAAIILLGTMRLAAQGGPQPAFGQLVATPAGFVPSTPTVVPNIATNSPTVVTFTIRISTPTLNPTTVELQRIDATGKFMSVVSKLYDDGSHGDVNSGDKLFTSTVTMNEATAGRIHLRVGAAFRGNTQNAWSQPSSLDVWQTFADNRLGVSIRIPPDWDPLVVEPGDYITSAGNVSCTESAALPSATSIAGNDPLPLYDFVATGADGADGLTIEVRTLALPATGSVILCHADDQRFDLTSERVAAETSGFTTAYGAHLLSGRPPFDFVDSGSDATSDTPVYILQRYVAYETGKRIEIRLLAAIEASDLAAFTCPFDLGRRFCAEQYFFNSPLASHLRAAFERANAIVETLGE